VTLTTIALIGVAVVAILGAAGAFAVAYRRSQTAERPDPFAGVSPETRAADRPVTTILLPRADAETEPVEEEVEEVLDRPFEDRPGHEGSRVASGQTRAGRYVRVIYVPDPEPDSVFVITAYELGPKAKRALRRRRKQRR